MDEIDVQSIISTENAAPPSAGLPVDSPVVVDPRQHLIEILSGGKNKKYVRFAMAALGSIPWVGNLITMAANLGGAVSDLKNGSEQDNVNLLLSLWLDEHQEKFRQLGITFAEIFSRFENFGDDIQQRLESPEYLDLVRRSFSSWDQADTEEKRQMYKRLLISAGATTLSSDDMVRLFIRWIDSYHESHFAVMREIFHNSGITRGQIWDNMHPGERPRDDSSAAGFFGYLIRELTLGGVIHQQESTDGYGHAIKKQRPKNSSPSGTKKSNFDDIEPYELTELGKEFVHYVMKDVAPQISDDDGSK